MKAASSSKMSVNNYQKTYHHIPEDFNDHNKTNYEKQAQCTILVNSLSSLQPSQKP
jgi:hypothetical protein